MNRAPHIDNNEMAELAKTPVGVELQKLQAWLKNNPASSSKQGVTRYFNAIQALWMQAARFNKSSASASATPSTPDKIKKMGEGWKARYSQLEKDLATINVDDSIKKTVQSALTLLANDPSVKKLKGISPAAQNSIPRMQTQEADRAREDVKERKSSDVKAFEKKYPHLFAGLDEADELRKLLERYLAALHYIYGKNIYANSLKDIEKVRACAREFQPEDNFEKIPAGKPVQFTNPRGKRYSIDEKSITFEDGDRFFTYADAQKMVHFIRHNRNALVSGVTLGGTPTQRAMLQRAIQEDNKGRPKSERLLINNPFNALSHMGARKLFKADRRIFADTHPGMAKHFTSKLGDFARAAASDEYEAIASKSEKGGQLTKGILKSVGNSIRENNDARRKSIQNFLKAAGYTGKIKEGVDQTILHFEKKGLIKMNEAGNKRIVIKQDFNTAASNITQAVSQKLKNGYDTVKEGSAFTHFMFGVLKNSDPKPKAA